MDMADAKSTVSSSSPSENVFYALPLSSPNAVTNGELSMSLLPPQSSFSTRNQSLDTCQQYILPAVLQFLAGVSMGIICFFVMLLFPSWISIVSPALASHWFALVLIQTVIIVVMACAIWLIVMGLYRKWSRKRRQVNQQLHDVHDVKLENDYVNGTKEEETEEENQFWEDMEDYYHTGFISTLVLVSVSIFVGGSPILAVLGISVVAMLCGWWMNMKQSRRRQASTKTVLPFVAV